MGGGGDSSGYGDKRKWQWKRGRRRWGWATAVAGTAVERGAEARGVEMMAVAMVEAKRVLRTPYGDGAMGGGDGERVDASAWSICAPWLPHTAADVRGDKQLAIQASSAPLASTIRQRRPASHDAAARSALPRRRLAVPAGSAPARAPIARTELTGAAGPGACRHRRCGQACRSWDRQWMASSTGRAYHTAHGVGVR